MPRIHKISKGEIDMLHAMLWKRLVQHEIAMADLPVINRDSDILDMICDQNTQEKLIDAFKIGMIPALNLPKEVDINWSFDGGKNHSITMAVLGKDILLPREPKIQECKATDKLRAYITGVHLANWKINQMTEPVVNMFSYCETWEAIRYVFTGMELMLSVIGMNPIPDGMGTLRNSEHPVIPKKLHAAIEDLNTYFTTLMLITGGKELKPKINPTVKRIRMTGTGYIQ